MNERQTPPVDLGIYQRASGRPGFDRAERIAAGLSIAWLVVCGAYLGFAGLGEGADLGGLRVLIVALALGLPVALIWIGAITLRSAAIMREESERLQASMNAMRQIYVANAQMTATAFGPNVAAKIDEIARGQKRAESAIAAAFSSRRSQPDAAARGTGATAARPEPAPSAPSAPDPSLDLGPAPAAPPVSNADFIRALNFPEDAEDSEGFASLRRALADPAAAPVVRAAQDLLTLLSQDGIYMDDLTPDRARPDLWRRFASGTRGAPVAALGGIRDRASLALAAGRMRKDELFRDAAHHFLRSFDRALAATSDRLSDEELVRLADTRSARAFMLMGRVAGMFDAG